MRPLDQVTFDYNPRTRLIFGAGCVDRIGALVTEHGGADVLLVTDPGIVAAGHAQHVVDSLTAAGLRCRIFDQVHENPTTRDVDACVEVARAGAIDLLVALGGGSAMDAAKGCNFLLTNGGRMQDYWGSGKAIRAMLPLIAVPTTAGTGSEMQSFALIADEHTHQKMACGDPKASARVALLDPELAVSQPRFVAACTGLDAITHAVETAVTNAGTPISRLFARESFRLAVASFPRVLETPDDLEAQGRMMLAAAYAGTAIENSMLGAAHSMANPLTARYGTVHGQAVGICLPHVVEFNRRDPVAAAAYAELARAAGLTVGDGNAAVDALAERLRELLAIAEAPRSLAEVGVAATAVSELAEDAARQWTAQFNPRPLEAADFARLYEAAL